MDAQARESREKREVQTQLRRKANQTAREVKKFWRQIEQVGNVLLAVGMLREHPPDLSAQRTGTFATSKATNCSSPAFLSRLGCQIHR